MNSPPDSSESRLSAQRLAEIEQTSATPGPLARLRRVDELDLSDPADCRFDDYELRERLGAGGMAVVYRAYQFSLDREVAVKLLDFDPFAAEDMVSLFRSEARHAGRLQHPNIVPVYEIGQHGSFYYFSMGLVRGPTLREHLDRAPMADPRQIAYLLRTVAEAVEYAHQVGILHLDLKPGNVLIDERGQPQVSDFGLARRLDVAGDPGAFRVIAGTPAYMAPEQARADPAALGPATDVWGLGGILYAMLTGRSPFAGLDAEDTRRRVMVDTLQAPRSLAKGIAPDLDAICLHCLHKDPAQRYPSARALADDLQRFLDGRPVSVRAQGRVERLRNWARREPSSALMAAGLLLALLSGLSATTVLWLQAEQNRAQAQSTLWDMRRASALASAEREDPLAGLTALVANISEAEAAERHVEAEQDRRRVTLLLDQAPRQIAGWSFEAEGRSLAFAEQGRLLLAGLRNGELVALELPEGLERWRIQPEFPPTPWGASFVGRIEPTADGRHALLYPSGSSGVVRPDSSHMHRVHLADGRLDVWPVPATRDSVQIYSADGSHLLLGHGGEARVINSDTGEPAHGPVALGDIRHCLLASSGDAWGCAVDGFAAVDWTSATAGSDPAPLRLAFADDSELLSWSLSERWLALGSSSGRLLLFEPDSGRVHRLGQVAEDGLSDLRFAGDVLVVSSNAGSLRMLDLGELHWLGRPLRSDQARIHSAQLDRERGWLLANDSRAVLWRFEPGMAPGGMEPRHVQVLRTVGPLVGFHATAIDAASGWLASHGNDGELKLYRLPAEPFRTRSAGLLFDTDLALAPAMSVRVQGDTLWLKEPGAPVPRRVQLEQPAYRVAGSGNARWWLAASGHALMVLDPSGNAQRIELPGSAQYLSLAGNGERVLVGWIAREGRLRLHWRVFDLPSSRWLGEEQRSEGLPSGVRLAPDGRAWVLWQGAQLHWYRTEATEAVGVLQLDSDGERINDVTFLQRDQGLLLASSQASQLLPAAVEHWRMRRGVLTREQRIETPNAYTRIFELDQGWFGHGPRSAVFRQGQLLELDQLGSGRGEAAALSPDRRWAALGLRASVLFYDLHKLQPLNLPQPLGLSRDDVITQLAFAEDGESVLVVSHFGERFTVSLAPDRRSHAALAGEAWDLNPNRALDQVRPPAIERAARVAVRPNLEQGLEVPATHEQAALGSAAAPALFSRLPAGASTSAQGRAVSLAAVANVPTGIRFQGARRGLGITDSAGWPQGRVRLRGIDFELGAALQLAPEGQALGAARFPQSSGAIELPRGPGTGLALLLANQHEPEPGGLRLHWLSETGDVLATEVLEVPTSWDGSIHQPERNHQPRADVALIVRTAETHQRGGGSELQLIYLLEVTTPPGARAIRLEAAAATPLLLGASVLEQHGDVAGNQ